MTIITEKIFDFQSILDELNAIPKKTISITEENHESFHVNNNNLQLFKINELSVQEQFFLHQDLENVFDSLSSSKCQLIYIVSGKLTGIEMYIGVLDKEKDSAFNFGELLKHQLQGNISGIELTKVSKETLKEDILASLENSIHFGLVSGVPSLTIDQQAQSQGKVINQGLDRLAKTLMGEEWQIVLVAQPLPKEKVQKQILDIVQLSTNFSPYIKKTTQFGTNGSKTQTLTDGLTTTESESKQQGKNASKTYQESTNTQSTTQKGKSATQSYPSRDNSTSDSSGTSEAKGTSNSNSTTTGDSSSSTTGKSTAKNKSTADGATEGYSRSENHETTNRHLERLEKHISETQIKRYELGASKGLFLTAIYLCAKRPPAYERLAFAFQAIFQGNQSLYNPLLVQKIHFSKNDVEKLFGIHYHNKTMLDATSLIKSQFINENNFPAHATLLNSGELALLAGLPTKEVCGISLRKNVDFSVNPARPKETGFELGNIILNGRELTNAKVNLDKKLLNQHIFISGVTGAGKTTTCQQLLLKSELPFLVIEPAKTEYRTLYQIDKEMQFYTLNNENISPFRFNPFELLPSEQLLSHIDTLKATFAAVFPMEASMPYLIEEAIVKSYESKGWDINTSKNYFYSDPWQSNGECFPIMSEMLVELEHVIESKKFGQELQEKYRGSLISRLDNLTIGSKGRMLNTRRSIDIIQMMKQKVVIELEELKDEQDKALIMGLLIGRVAEAVKYLHRQDHNFQHLTLIEEAHRLLEKTDGYQDGAKKLGVNLFANLLAEVRKYGEGLIIADQIPNKLAVEVLKNTNTKIIHRLFASDDRRTMGETIGLEDEQIEFLPMLKAGEAIIYSAGWHGAVRMQVNKINDTNAKVMDETIIAEHSKARIFQQRHRLFPLLGKQWTENDKNNLQDFVLEGSFVLNMWLKWYHLNQDRQNPAKKSLLTAQMKLKLAEFYQKWQFLDNIDLALAYLFLDTAPIAYMENHVRSSSRPIEDYLMMLFSIYHKENLDNTMPLDGFFGLEHTEGRLVQKIINELFSNLNTI